MILKTNGSCYAKSYFSLQDHEYQINKSGIGRWRWSMSTSWDGRYWSGCWSFRYLASESWSGNIYDS